MSLPAQRFPMAFLSLSLAAAVAVAAPSPVERTGDRLHAAALDSFRQGRFPEAYGRLIALADAGHVPSADLALWMYQNGPTVFGKEWDSTPEQLKSWAALAGRPEPAMLPSNYPPSATAAGRGATARRAGPEPAVQWARSTAQPVRSSGRP